MSNPGRRTCLWFLVRPRCLRAHGTNKEPSWKFDTGRLNCRFKGLRIPSSFLIMYSHSPRCLVRQRTLKFDLISNRWSRAQGPSLHKSKRIRLGLERQPVFHLRSIEIMLIRSHIGSGACQSIGVHFQFRLHVLECVS